MNLTINDWQYFRVGKLFKLDRGKEAAPKQNPVGDCNLINETGINNGFTRCVEPTKVFKGNAITVSINYGENVFYQPFDFCASVNIVVLRNDTLNRESGLFIATVLSEVNSKFGYGYKTSNDRIKATLIKLPTLKNDDGTFYKDETKKYSDEGYVPDFDYMERFIKSLKQKPITTKTKKNESNTIDFTSWKKKKVSDIFKPFISGKGLTEQEIKDNPGNLVAVQSSSDNNACMGFIDEEYCVEKGYKIVKTPCLTVARSGSAGFVSYQDKGCVIGDSAKILLLKKEDANKYHYLFMRTILMANYFKFAYGRKVRIEQYMNMDLLIPWKDNNPDWDYMEEFIKSLPYSDRI